MPNQRLKRVLLTLVRLERVLLTLYAQPTPQACAQLTLVRLKRVPNSRFMPCQACLHLTLYAQPTPQACAQLTLYAQPSVLTPHDLVFGAFTIHFYRLSFFLVFHTGMLNQRLAKRAPTHALCA